MPGAPAEDEGPLLVDAISALPGGIAVVAPDGTVLAVNERFVEVVGRGAAPTAGEPVPTGAPWWVSVVSAVAADPFRYQHPNGELRWLEGHTSTLRTDADTYRLIIVDDVTSAVENRNALAGDRAVRSQLAHQLEDVNEQLNRANAELLRFAGAVAHDLRAPLANIVGFADVLPDVAQLGERGPEVLARLRDNARRATVMVTDLLAYARTVGSKGEATAVELSGVVRWAANAVQDRLVGAAGRIDYGALPQVLANRAALRQVMLNLFDNAITFRRPDVPLAIRVEALPGIDPLMVELHVVDNGIGIPEAHRRRIFELGAQVDPGRSPGSGIGLASCAGVLAAMGGAIWVADPPEGGGTTMALRMPIATHADTEALQGSVLIVDDDEDAVHVVRLFASSLGLDTVGEATTAAEARQLFLSLPRPPDVVVLDLTLPDGDGLALAKWFLERREGQKILVYSSHADLVVMELANAIGISHAIGKGHGDEFRAALRDLTLDHL